MCTVHRSSKEGHGGDRASAYTVVPIHHRVLYVQIYRHVRTNVCYDSVDREYSKTVRSTHAFCPVHYECCWLMMIFTGRVTLLGTRLLYTACDDDTRRWLCTCREERLCLCINAWHSSGQALGSRVLRMYSGSTTETYKSVRESSRTNPRRTTPNMCTVPLARMRAYMPPCTCSGLHMRTYAPTSPISTSWIYTPMSVNASFISSYLDATLLLFCYLLKLDDRYAAFPSSFGPEGYIIGSATIGTGHDWIG